MMPRLRARSSSLNSPSGCSQSMIRWAYCSNSSGRYPLALSARSASAASRVPRSISVGRCAKKRRITLTCPSLISPPRWAVAVADNCGANGSPVNARRSPRSSASAIRRPASALVIRSLLANAQRSVPPNSSSPACASSWLINPCPGARRRRVARSRRSNARNRSGVVSTSKVNSHKRSRAASCTSKTSTISSRLLAPMPELYEHTPTENPSL